MADTPEGEDDVSQTAGVSMGGHQTVGNYRIVRQLGQGGMGAVFEAVHDRIGSRAAIKVLHPHLAQEASVAVRFLNEARAVNIVSHPGLVNIFEFDQLPDRTVYIVMEYLAGESLARRLRHRDGGLGAEAIVLARQIASAVAAAHGKGIVHRDLKPDNVMLIADPEIPGGERTKVLDFGIAKLAGTAEADGASASGTRTGAVLGTPLYMSPEQCRGTVAVTDRADVYALGVMLFQMVAGRTPFRSDSAGELISMHLLQPPPALDQLVPWSRGDLAALVRRMLAKDPAARPSMAEVADSLLRVRGAPADAAGGRGQRRLTLALAAVAAAAAAAAAAGLLARRPGGTQPAPAASAAASGPKAPLPPPVLRANPPAPGGPAAVAASGGPAAVAAPGGPAAVAAPGGSAAAARRPRRPSDPGERRPPAAGASAGEARAKDAEKRMTDDDIAIVH